MDDRFDLEPLADLLSADAFTALLEREELRRGRTGEELAVAVLDMDGFGEVRKRHGEDGATQALVACADALRQSLRAPDEVALTGPDEFIVLLHATDSKAATAWEERFEGTLETLGGELPMAPVTCAIGIADTGEAPTLMDVAGRARRRMEVIQTVRKLKRARESGHS